MTLPQCLLELQREAVFLWTSELENISTLCFRAFEGSNHNVRVAVAELLGTLLAAAVQPLQPAGNVLQLTVGEVRSGRRRRLGSSGPTGARRPDLTFG